MIITQKCFNRIMKEHDQNYQMAKRLAERLNIPESESTWIKFLNYSKKNFLRIAKLID